jgi:hypothetical protein
MIEVDKLPTNVQFLPTNVQFSPSFLLYLCAHEKKIPDPVFDVGC